MPFVFAALLIPLLASLKAEAADVLPYSSRSLPYSGYTTAVSGDIRTVGMAGATVGLADTYFASHSNPGGMAMTLKTGDTHLTANEIRDANIQSLDFPISRNSLGLGVSANGWGVGLGTAVQHREDQPYILSGGIESRLELAVREYRLSVGRLFPNRRLSVGASLRMGVATLAAHPPGAQNVEQTSTNAGVAFGATYRLPGRVLFGLSYSAPMKYDFQSGDVTGAAPNGFYQNVEVPGVLGTGVGWIPNRFWRMDLSTQLVQRNDTSALLYDQSALVGEKLTLQPHVGAAYVFADFRNVSGTFFGGSYYEVSRISGRPNRLHFTIGSELKISFVNFGIGYDGAPRYRNYIASIGIDIFNLAAKMDIIPRDREPDRRGFFPSPFENSEAGLASGLQDYPDTGLGIDPIQAGLDVPGNIGRTLENATQDGVPGLGKKMLKALESIPFEIDQEIQEMKRVERRQTERRNKQKLEKEKKEKQGGKKKKRTKKL